MVDFSGKRNQMKIGHSPNRARKKSEDDSKNLEKVQMGHILGLGNFYKLPILVISLYEINRKNCSLFF